MLCDLGHDTRFPAPGSQGIARGREMSMMKSSLAKCERAECTVENMASGVRQLDLNPGTTTYLFFFFPVPSLIKHD